MNGLVSTDNVIHFIADHIILEQVADLGNRYVGYNHDNTTKFITEDDSYTLVEFDEADMPIDYMPEKYKYIDGQFVVNPDYGTGEESVKTKLEELDKKFTDEYNDVNSKVDNTNNTINSVSGSLNGRISEEEEALCDLDETYTQRLSDVEEALCELAELIEQ